MEVLAVLLVGAVLSIPVIAIIALVRSGETRRLLDEALKESDERVSNLSREIVALRRELADLSARAAQPAPVTPPAPQTAPRQEQAPQQAAHAPQPTVAPFEAPNHPRVQRLQRQPR
jgi:hypothetical protein